MGCANSKAFSNNPFKENTEALVAKCDEILKKHPGNRCCKYLKEYVTSDEFKALSEAGELTDTQQSLYSFLYPVLHHLHLIDVFPSDVSFRPRNIVEVCPNWNRQ